MTILVKGKVKQYFFIAILPILTGIALESIEFIFGQEPFLQIQRFFYNISAGMFVTIVMVMLGFLFEVYKSGMRSEKHIEEHSRISEDLAEYYLPKLSTEYRTLFHGKLKESALHFRNADKETFVTANVHEFLQIYRIVTKHYINVDFFATALLSESYIWTDATPQSLIEVDDSLDLKNQNRIIVERMKNYERSRELEDIMEEYAEVPQGEFTRVFFYSAKDNDERKRRIIKRQNEIKVRRAALLDIEKMLDPRDRITFAVASNRKIAWEVKPLGDNPLGLFVFTVNKDEIQRYVDIRDNILEQKEVKLQLAEIDRKQNNETR